jgi:hypothetical protein
MESTRVSRDGSASSRLNRQGSQATISYPDAEEMDAAFDDGSDSDSDDGNAQSRLLKRTDGARQGNTREESQFQIGGDDSDEEEDAERKAGREVQDVFSDPLRQEGGGDKPSSQSEQQNGRMPGDYDFDRDYVSSTCDSNPVYIHADVRNLPVPSATADRFTSAFPTQFPSIPRSGKRQRNPSRLLKRPQVCKYLITSTVTHRLVTTVILWRKSRTGL